MQALHCRLDSLRPKTSGLVVKKILPQLRLVVLKMVSGWDLRSAVTHDRRWLSGARSYDPRCVSCRVN
jgi:hypothetical protein